MGRIIPYKHNQVGDLFIDEIEVLKIQFDNDTDDIITIHGKITGTKKGEYFQKPFLIFRGLLQIGSRHGLDTYDYEYLKDTITLECKKLIGATSLVEVIMSNQKALNALYLIVGFLFILVILRVITL